MTTSARNSAQVERLTSASQWAGALDDDFSDQQMRDPGAKKRSQWAGALDDDFSQLRRELVLAIGRVSMGRSPG